MQTIKKFISYYKPYKGMFFMDMVCALILSLVDLSFPLIVSYLVNNIYQRESSQIIKYVIIIGTSVFLMYVLRYFCQYYITSWGHIMGARMEADMREDLFSHLQKLSFSYYDNTNTGTLMSRIVTDLFDISELAHHGPEDLFVSMLKIVGTFVVLMTIDWRITSILAMITLIMIISSIYYNKKMKATFKKNRERIADVNAQIQDSLSGIRVVKSFSNEKIENEKFREGNNAFLETKEKGYYIMGRFFSMNGFFQGILYLSVVILGGIFISYGTFRASDLMIYVLYINIFINPIDKLVNFTEQYQRGITGFDRFLEVIETDPEIVEKKNALELKNIKGKIDFENVSFSYDNRNKVLDDVSLSIDAGKTVAIVGPSGSGKTTFCSIIPRFYDVSYGNVKVDGIDIRNLKIRSLRKNIGIVQQDVYMFTGTIKENIAYGDINATDEQIIDAAKRANAHEFILQLENGYDSYVGERGVKLSGGQKQRISIARVFLKNPKILILDEATSALDNESERLIQKALDLLAKDRTTIVIAHRLSTIINADEIVLLTDEGIKEKGTHKELLELGGEYAHLYNMQFDKEKFTDR